WSPGSSLARAEHNTAYRQCPPPDWRTGTRSDVRARPGLALQGISRRRVRKSPQSCPDCLPLHRQVGLQRAFLDFAVGILGQLNHAIDALGALEAELRAGKVDNLALVHGVAQRDIGDDRVAPLFVGLAHNRAFLDRGVKVKRLFDL